MPISEDLVDALRCNFSGRDHFLIDALILPCGHSICKECAQDSLGDVSFFCAFPGCEKSHLIKNLDHLKNNSTVQVLIKTYENDLFELAKKDFEKLVSDCEVSAQTKIIQQTLNEIDEQIDKRAEELTQQLNSAGDDLMNQISIIKDNIIK